MLKAKHAVLIRRPIEEVFQFVATDYFQNRPKWAPMPAGVEVLENPEGPIRIGAIARYRSVDRWGWYADTTYTVTEYQPTAKVALQTETRFSELQPKRRLNQKAYSRTTNTASEMLFTSVEIGTKIVFETKVWFTGMNKAANWYMERRVALTQDEGLEKARDNAYKIKNLLEAQAGLPPSKKPLRIRRTWVVALAYVLLFAILLWMNGAREALRLSPDWVNLLRGVMIGMIIIGFLALFVKGMFQNSDVRRD